MIISTTKQMEGMRVGGEKEINIIWEGE